MRTSAFLATALALLAGCADQQINRKFQPEGCGLPSVVFDIDGTLTPSPSELFTARPDAVEAVKRYQSRGYAPVYLTARPNFMSFATRRWLEWDGFPVVPLYMAPFEGARERAGFKTEVLKQLAKDERRMWLYAYGDSTTDFQAYENAGLPPTHVFALKRAGTTECEPGKFAKCLSSFRDHLEWIDEQPEADPCHTGA